MEKQIIVILSHVAHTQEEMAAIIQSERHVVNHASSLITGIPREYPEFVDLNGLKECSLQVTKSVASYLNSLASLEEALADNLRFAMKELRGSLSEE